MCLELIVTLPDEPFERLEEIAHSCTSAGPLEVAVDYHGWFRRSFYLRVSEPGEGCACGMLAENATWDSATWALRPEATTKLTETVRRVAESAGGPWTFVARWDPPTEKREVNPQELVDIIARGAIGTHTQYVVARGAG